MKKAPPRKHAGTRCATCGRPPHHHYTTRTGRGMATDHPFAPAPVAERCACGHGFHEPGRCGDKRLTFDCGCSYSPDNQPAPVADGGFAQIERDGKFAGELIVLLNRYSQENASNTPDFILANYMIACLRAFNEASRAKENWYGKSLHV